MAHMTRMAEWFLTQYDEMSSQKVLSTIPPLQRRPIAVKREKDFASLQCAPSQTHCCHAQFAPLATVLRQRRGGGKKREESWVVDDFHEMPAIMFDLPGQSAATTNVTFSTESREKKNAGC